VLGLTVKAAKSAFFDREKVQAAMDKATHSVLSRFGAFVRQRARTSLRYRSRPSAPGKPPSAHRTMPRPKAKTNKAQAKQGRKQQKVSPLREFVFFAFDWSTRSVVIGPALLNAKGGAGVLKALEYGGSSVIRDRGKTKRVRIRPRPFMRPAFIEELKTMPPRWRNSVR